MDTQENRNFDLLQHSTNMINAYLPDVSEEGRNRLIANIRENSETYYLGDLTWWPSKEQLKEKAPPRIANFIKTSKIKKILKKMKNGKSPINQELKKILTNTDVTIAICPPDRWKKPNGGMVFKRSTDGKTNQAVLFVADVACKNEQLLAGIIAHEMGHLVEFYHRPQAQPQEITFVDGEKGMADPNKVLYMDGSETLADTLGEKIAQGAGYSCLSFGRFMLEESQKGNNPLHTPPGEKRYTNIALVGNIINGKASERSQSPQTAGNAPALKDKMMSLRGVSSFAKPPYKPAKPSNVDLKTLQINRIGNSR